MTRLRAVILDDYAGAALECADWSVLDGRVDVDVIREHVPEGDGLVDRLSSYDIVVAMRERTPLPSSTPGP